jgi:outer membrane protein TolC
MCAHWTAWRFGRPNAVGIAGSGCLLAVAIAVLGCAGQAPIRYRELSRSLESSEASSPTSGEDVAFAGRAVLERATYVRALLDRNPTIQAARHAWGAALERYPQVTAFDDPTLGYGVAPRSFGAQGVDDAHVVDLSQAIPFPGKLGLRGEAALAEAEAAQGDFEAVRLRLATMGSMLFDDYYYATRAREINGQHVALVEDFKRIALVRYEAGEATQQDPLQAETELARLLQRGLELDTRVRVARQQLNALLHRRIDADLPPPPASLTPPPLGLEDPSAESLATAALDARPELGAADARVRAREAEVGSARRDYFPDVTLVGNYNGRIPVDENRPFVGVRFSVPLQQGRLRAALAEARRELAAARSRRERIADQVELSVHESLAEWQSARDVAALFGARLLPAARDRVAAARAGFESGGNSFLELIDAERQLRSIELDHEAARADVSRRSAQLLRALGRMPGIDDGTRLEETR